MDQHRDLEYAMKRALIHVLLNPPRPPPCRLPNLTLGGTNLSADMAPVKPSMSRLSLSVVFSKVELRPRALSSISALFSAAELLLRGLPDLSRELR
jgi:hypothetical protein